MLQILFMLALAAVVAGLLYMWRQEMLERICSAERRLREGVTQEQLKDFAQSLKKELEDFIRERAAPRPAPADELPPPPGFRF